VPVPVPEPAKAPEVVPSPEPAKAPEVTPSPEPAKAPEVAPSSEPAKAPAPVPAKKRAILRLSEILANTTVRWTELYSSNFSFGIHLANTTRDSMFTAHWKLLGMECAANEIFDGQACVAASQTLKDGVKVQVNLTDANPTEVVAISSEVNTAFYPPSSLKITTGHGIVAKAFFANQPVGITANSIPFPRTKASYFFSLSKENNTVPVVDSSFQVSLDYCNNMNTTGPHCSYPIYGATDTYVDISRAVYKGNWTYYRFVSSGKPFRASLNVQEDNVQADMFVSLGAFPSPDDYDVKNCNYQYCASNNIIAFDRNTNAGDVYYVAVATNTTAHISVWFTSACATGCDDNGVCEPTTGVCTCNDPVTYAGVACKPTGVFGTQYIVLIVIASLVVISAIIGFVAWAYMKRKSDYQRISP